MKSGRIPNRYAKALFDLAGETNITARVNEDMKLVGSVCRSNMDFRQMLESPVIRSDKKLAVVRALFGTQFHEMTLAYLEIIIRKRREMFFEGIAAEFNKLFEASTGVKKAFLKTAVEADAGLKQQVVAMLEKQLNCKIELVTIVDKKLLGGFVLQVDDQQWDASAQHKINQLIREFNVNMYERKL